MPVSPAATVTWDIAKSVSVRDSKPVGFTHVGRRHPNVSRKNGFRGKLITMPAVRRERTAEEQRG